MLSTTTEQDSDDSLYKYRRKSRRQGVSSIPSDSDFSDVARPHRRKKCRVSSSSSDSDNSLLARPSRKKCKVLSESESDSTATSDSEEERNLRRRRDRRPNKHTVSSDSEGPPEKGSPKATNSATVDLNSSDSDEGEKCIICFKSLRPPFAHPSNCSHHFHPNCLATWTKTSNTCPIDRVKYTAILVVDNKGDLISREGVTTPPPQDHNADFEPDDATFCEVCSQHDREHEMLLCDRCEAGYHLDCLTPPLREVPDGNWFCPRCTDLGNELTEEMNDLIDDAAIILETRMRQRSAPSSRMPSRPRTRGAQRVFNIIHHQQTTDQPSTSSVTIRRRHTSTRRPRQSKSSRRPQSTRYKVELITVEDGTTLEVKVAVDTRTRTKSKRHSRRKSKKCSKSSHKSGGPSTSRDTVFTGEGPSHGLDLFGSRPQFDYFSGCEAEDELDDDCRGGGGVSAMSRGPRTGVRNMASRKQIAAQILNTHPRRQAPRIEVSRAPVDLVSSIIEQQEKWHAPGATYESTSNGDIRVIMKESRSAKIRQAGGSSGSSSGNAPSTSVQTSSSTSQPSRDAGSSVSAGGSREACSSSRPSSASSSRNDDDGQPSISKTSSSSERVPSPKITAPSEIGRDNKDENDLRLTEGGPSSDDPPQPPLSSSSLVEKKRDDSDDIEEQDCPIQGINTTVSQDVANNPDDLDKADEDDVTKPTDVDSFHTTEDQRVPEDLSMKKTSFESTEKVEDEVDVDENLGGNVETNLEGCNAVVDNIQRDVLHQLDDNKIEDDSTATDDAPPVDQESGAAGQKHENDDAEADDEDSESDQDVASLGENLDSKVVVDVPIDGDNVENQDGFKGKTEGNEPDQHGDPTEGKQEAAGVQERNSDVDFVEPEVEGFSSDGAVNETDNLDHVDETKDVAISNTENDKASRDDESRGEIGEGCPDVNAIDSDTYDEAVPEKLAESSPVICSGDVTEDIESSTAGASQSQESELGKDGKLNEEETKSSEDDQVCGLPSNSPHNEPFSKDEEGYGNENQDTKLDCETLDSKPQDYDDGKLEESEGKESSAKAPIPEKEQETRSDPAGDLLDIGCEEEKDGLVDITDEEISSYERSWEMEENGEKKKTEGLEGLDTEAISDCEYHPVESDVSRTKEIEDDQEIQPSNQVVEEGSREEEGEIVTEERIPGPKKKVPKDRNYRGDMKNKSSTQTDKQSELERYDARRVIAEKPQKKGDLARDISSDSGSTSLSSSIGRSISRDKMSRSRSRGRIKERVRGRPRARSRSRSKERVKDRTLSRENRRNRSRDKHSRSRSRKRRRTRTPRRDRRRSRDRNIRDRQKKKRSPSSSGSSCSCSSCEREKKRNEKLTVIVPREGKVRERSRNRGKNKKDKRRSRSRNRKRKTPVPSKEVFTSGNNILVSVNFKSSNAAEAGRMESAPPSKRKKDDEARKKKDKRTKESLPMRSTVSKTTPKKRKLNTSNMKPVAIIDLDTSPFRETTLSPKEVIILTDSDDEDKLAKADATLQMSGPKTPPEPHIKFSISNSSKQQQQLRGMPNPLVDKTGREDDDVIHIGPNTPPEPSAPYDPFEPTKSRSPSPGPTSRSDRIPSPAQEPKQRHSPFQSQTSHTPPKLSQHDSPKTPSPLQSVPKEMDNMQEKNKQVPFQPAGMDSGDDSGGGGGDSPYSPGSSEGDDLFEPPMAQSTSALKSRQRPTATQSKPKVPPPKVAMTAQKHSNNLTKEASKKGPVKKDIGMKLDDDQLKILDDLPNSAVEMQVKDKFLKKLNRQERVVEEVKLVLKPHYAKKHVNKEEYKEILRRAVPKICHSRSGEINPMKIQRLIEAYVKKYRHKMKRKGSAPTIPPLRQNKPVAL